MQSALLQFSWPDESHKKSVSKIGNCLAHSKAKFIIFRTISICKQYGKPDANLFHSRRTIRQLSLVTIWLLF